MSDSFDEHLSRRLAALRADLAGTTLPGADAARRRAAQRTRHQVTGSLVAGVAVVAVGVFGIVQPQFRALQPQPADSPTTTVTAAPDGALLTADDIRGPADIAWEPAPASTPSFACVPAAPSNAAQAHFVAPQGAQFHQFVTPGDTDEFADLRAQIEACVADLGQQDERYGLFEAWEVAGIGDEAWMAAYAAPLLTADEFAETSIVELRLVRAGGHLTVVAEGGPGQDYNEAMPTDRADAAATRLCAALDVDPCTGDPEPTRVYPTPGGDLPGWLSPADVAAAIDVDGTVDGGDVMPTDGWGYVGLPVDPGAAGAQSVEVRSYGVVGADPGLALFETVARFGDAAAARSHYAELVAAADAFTQDGDIITNTGGLSGPDYEGMTWRSENRDLGLTFVYGAVVRGNAVAVVTHGIDGFEDRQVSPDDVAGVLDAAAQQLTDG